MLDVIQRRLRSILEVHREVGPVALAIRQPSQRIDRASAVRLKRHLRVSRYAQLLNRVRAIGHRSLSLTAQAQDVVGTVTCRIARVDRR
jgi:hypothetical protein